MNNLTSIESVVDERRNENHLLPGPALVGIREWVRDGLGLKLQSLYQERVVGGVAASHVLQPDKRQCRLPVILFSLMAGASVGGLVGVVFSVPVACMIKVSFQVGWEWYRTEFNIRPTRVPPSAARIPTV